MMRKLIMSISIVFFLRNTKVGIAALICFSSAFAILHSAKAQIRDIFENNIQLLSLWLIPINLMIGILIGSTNVGDEAVIPKVADNLSLEIMLVVLNLLLLILIIGRLFWAVVRKLVSPYRSGGLHSCLRFLCGCFRTNIKLGPDHYPVR